MKIPLLCVFVVGLYLSDSFPTNSKQNDDEDKVKDIFERLHVLKRKKYEQSSAEGNEETGIKDEEEKRITEEEETEQFLKTMAEKRIEDEMNEVTQEKKNAAYGQSDNLPKRNNEEGLNKSIANDNNIKISSNVEREIVQGLQELPIDNPEKVDPNSPLEFLMEGMIIEEKGKQHEVQGLRPEDNEKTIGDTLDSHKHVSGDPQANSDYYGKTRNFITYTDILWHKGIIPYRMYNMSTNAVNVIKQAIQQFNTYTCVRWVPESTMANYNLNHKNVIYFINENGCWSYVGNMYDYWLIQPISLQEPECISVATAVHEMMHALGSNHEQSRKDRDKYVDIAYENVQGGMNNINFNIENTEINNPYDAESAMQYGLYSFSVNGEKTILFKDQRLEFLADSADGLEFYDIKDINDAYHCADSCINPPTCQNGGYVNFKCACVCPNKLTGAECTQTVSNSVANSYSCGGIIEIGTGIQYIQSPNFGSSNYPTGLDCTWLIKGVPNNIVRATVQYMDISAGSACYHFLEFRYNLMGQAGPKRCGTNYNDEVWDSTVDEISNGMIIGFNSDLYKTYSGSSGFKIKLESIGTGCVSNPCVYGKCYSPVGTSSYTCSCNPGVTGPICDILSASASVSCTFEYGERCFLTQDKADNFDWVSSSKFPPDYTGPSKAHGGYNCMYTEASYPRVPGEKAVLVNSVIQFASASRCLSFWYHMYGSSMGTLNVYTEGLNVPKSRVFTASGNKGNQWFMHEVDIPAMINLKLYFEGIRGIGRYSNMALDDINLKPGTCVSKITQAPTTPSATTKAPTTKASTPVPTTNAPTLAPTTKAPTSAPKTPSPTTKAPTTAPRTQAPTIVPTTKAPSSAPTTRAPTPAPTTKAPTLAPTTNAPTRATTKSPTPAPTTKASTLASTKAPTLAPTTKAPTLAPTTKAPTLAPTTKAPTLAPTTKAPTLAPTTKAPTLAPSTKAPTLAPTTKAPTLASTKAPTLAPTTKAPTLAPTTKAPTLAPTAKAPTSAPTTKAPTLTSTGKAQTPFPTG